MTEEKIILIIESAIAARIHSADGLISDARETLTHSTWLATVAIGLVAASATLLPARSSELTQITSALCICLSGASLVFGAIQSVTSNNLLCLYRQLSLSAMAEKVELLATTHSVSDGDEFAQKIYRSELASPEYRQQINTVNRKIKAHVNTERHANLQIRFMLGSVAAFCIQAILPVAISALQSALELWKTASS